MEINSCIPLLSTARHSSSLRWSGYVMLGEEEEEDLEEPNSAPRNGMPDMDRKGNGRSGILLPLR